MEPSVPEHELGAVTVPSEITGVVFTVTAVASDEEVQPATSTSTLYEPAVVTTMDCVVAPVDHVLPEAEDEVKVTDPPEQKVVNPLAEMVGTAGAPGSLIVVETVLEVHPLSKLKL